MSDRSTKTFTTPSGKEVVVKEYLTARERNELRGVTLNGLNIETTGDISQAKNITAEKLDQFQHKVIELAIVSYNGSAENILERLLDGTPDDYDAVVEIATATAGFKTAK